MTYFLKSPYPCLVKAGETEIEIDGTDTVEICDENFLFVYPQSEILPFYINLKVPKESDRFSICTLDQKKYIILEPEKNLKISTKKSLNFSGNRCQVATSEKTISFESEVEKIEIARSNSSALQEIFKINNHACVQFENEFFAFSTKTNLVTHIVGKVKREGENLTLTQTCQDSEGTQRQVTFKIGERIEILQENFLRNNTHHHPAELLPFQMLESVKEKDFSHAISLLSENLQNQLNSVKIHEFFGNFSAFLPISTTQFITLSPENKKFVTFEIENDKICDINIDEF